MPRFLHLADLHLTPRFAYLPHDKRESRREDFFSAFSRAVDFAADPQNSIDAVFIAGDLFDEMTPPKELVNRVKNEFEKLERAKKEVFLVPGTHDPAYFKDSVYKKQKFPGVTMLNEPEIKNPQKRNYDGVNFCIYGMEFDPARSKKPFSEFRAEDKNVVHIALIHGSLIAAAHWDTHDIYTPISPEDMEKSGINYFALGHYHNFAEYKKNNFTAVYPGTLEAKKSGEISDRYLVIAEFDKNGKLKIEKTPWNKREFAKLEIDLNREGIDSEKDVINLIRKNFADSDRYLLKLTFSGTAEFNINIKKIQEELEKIFFYIQVDDATSVFNSDKIEALSKERSVRGIFVQRILEKIPSAGDRELEVFKFALKAAVTKMERGEPLEI